MFQRVRLMSERMFNALNGPISLPTLQHSPISQTAASLRTSISQVSFPFIPTIQRRRRESNFASIKFHGLVGPTSYTPSYPLKRLGAKTGEKFAVTNKLREEGSANAVTIFLSSRRGDPVKLPKVERSRVKRTFREQRALIAYRMLPHKLETNGVQEFIVSRGRVMMKGRGFLITRNSYPTCHVNGQCSRHLSPQPRAQPPLTFLRDHVTHSGRAGTARDESARV